MRRSLFLVSVAGSALLATTPRVALPAAASVRVQSVRRARLRRVALAGSCADSRRKLRWSSFTSADFA